MERRKFIRNLSLTAAGSIMIPTLVKASALGRNGSVAASDRIVMGGIGVGSMGTGDMKNFLNNAGVQYVAVCDVDTTHSAKALGLIAGTNGNKDARSYGDYREFLEKEKLDAVHIALPDHWHALPSIAAANKGLDIYGQKPLARSVKEGRAIVNAAEKNNIVWQTGSQQRSGENFRKACELVRSGKLGKIDRVEVGLPDGGHKAGNPGTVPVPEELDWNMWLGPSAKVPYRGISHWDWRWQMAYSGGQLTDWAGHHIDIAQWGLGMERSGPISVEGEGQARENDMYDVPMQYDIAYEYANGIELRVANSRKYFDRKGKGWDGREKDNKFGMGAVWYGEEGWLQVNRSGMWSSNPKVLDIKLGSNDVHLYNSTNHHQNFLDCVKSRKETVAPAEIGHRSISVALIGEIAMATGKKLKWDPKAERFSNSDEANKMLQRDYRSPWKFPV